MNRQGRDVIGVNSKAVIYHVLRFLSSRASCNVGLRFIVRNCFYGNLARWYQLNYG